MLISFSGLDGAGKSTLIAWASARLQARGIAVVIFHMNDHIGIHAWLRMLRDAVAGRPHDLARATGSRPGFAKRVRDAMVWSPLLRAVIYPIDVLIFRVYRLWHEGVRRRVVIMDRYFYDTLVDLSAGRSPRPARALLRLTPTPDLAVLLDVDPAESFARKGEYSVPYLQRRHTAYHQVLSQVRSCLCIRNDDRAVTEQVLTAALEPLVARVLAERRTADADGPYAEQAAAFVLQALLHGVPVERPRANDWPLLASIARRNGVLLRLDAALAAADVERPAAFLAEVRAERTRAHGVLGTIARVAETLDAAAIDVVFPRAFMNLPDVGSDIDALVRADGGAAAAAVLELELGAVRLPARMRHAMEGSSALRVPGCPALVDLHHGRLGPAGEQAVFARHLMRTASTSPAGGNSARTAGAADQLVLLGQERVFGRRTLRLSDIVCTARLLRDESVDWIHVRDAACRTGSLGGLSCYLAYVEQIHATLSAEPLIPARLRNELRLSGWGTVSFRSGLYAFPALRVGARLGLERVGAALRARSWRSAARLGLLPLVALDAAVRRSRGPVWPVLALDTSHRLPE
jgi:thymidylate kinase